MIKKQDYNFIQYIIFVMIMMLFQSSANAIREPMPTAVDSRIRVMVFNPYDVFRFTGYYGYQTSIEFSKDEEVVSISMGDTTAWQIVPSGFRIFIKPMESDATTNMTIITNKRTYFFELHAEEANDINDPELVFNVKFLYPDENSDGSLKTYSSEMNLGPDLSSPEQYNFNYYVSGSKDIAPTEIYDDGEFTYIQFHVRNADMPAIFSVDEDLKEAMVNSRVSPTKPGLIIVERVFPKLTARHGKKIVCIFNESYREP
jgi:type IV secretion system protein VirB9